MAVVEWMDLCLRQKGPGTAEQIDAEKARLQDCQAGAAQGQRHPQGPGHPLTLRQREVLSSWTAPARWTATGSTQTGSRSSGGAPRCAKRSETGIPSPRRREASDGCAAEKSPNGQILRLLTEAQAMRPHETTLAVALEFRREAYELSKSEFAAIPASVSPITAKS